MTNPNELSIEEKAKYIENDLNDYTENMRRDNRRTTYVRRQGGFSNHQEKEPVSRYGW